MFGTLRTERDWARSTGTMEVYGALLVTVGSVIFNVTLLLAFGTPRRRKLVCGRKRGRRTGGRQRWCDVVRADSQLNHAI